MVLAAGLGRRLAGATGLPKWLTPVGGTCPAEVHLAAFEQAAVERVHVVVHPWADEIQELLDPWRDRLAVDVVVNHRAAEWNNWYSLLLGLDAWRETGSPDVVVVNSDLYAGRGWFAALVEGLRRVEGPAALAVDPSRGRTEEAMKVRLGRDGATVIAIGKAGIDRPGGEYVGLARWSSEGAAELAAVLDGFAGQPAAADHWYEHGIQRHLDGGGRYVAVAVPSPQWVEIDDEHDLELARRLPPEPVP